MAWHGMRADGAMFDEVSEGTAYYKIASRKSDTPANAPFVYNDIDNNDDDDGGHGGHHEANEASLPTDWCEKKAPFSSHLYTKRSMCQQDRLRTNIGQCGPREKRCFVHRWLQLAGHARAQLRGGTPIPKDMPSPPS
jgi:hypothetical protein